MACHLGIKSWLLVDLWLLIGLGLVSLVLLVVDVLVIAVISLVIRAVLSSLSFGGVRPVLIKGSLSIIASRKRIESRDVVVFKGPIQ